MDVRSRATKWKPAEAYSRFFLDILRNSSWILRRVETVEILDQNQLQRRVTLDIDLDDLRDRLKRAGLEGASRIYLPLFTQVKTLMLDLDVRSADGHAITLATSAQDSWVAYSMLLGVANEEGFEPKRFEAEVREAIYECARHMPSEDELRLAGPSLGHAAVRDYWMSRASGTFSSNSHRDTWEALFSNESFARLVADFSTKSMAVACVPLTGDSTAIVKYRYVDVGSPSSDPIPGEAWGLAAFKYLVPLGSIGGAQREHTRVIAPEGMQVVDVQLWEKIQPSVNELAPVRVSPRLYNKRVSEERAVVYTRRFPRGNYSVIVALQPRAGEFIAPALFSTALSAIMLGIFACLQLLHSFYFDSVTADDGMLGKVDVDSLTTTLLLFPTLLSLFLIRPREHHLASRLLSRLRILVLVSAFCMVASASAVALGVQGWLLGVVFCVGFAVSTAAFMVLFVGWSRGRERYDRVWLQSQRVHADNLLQSPYLPG